MNFRVVSTIVACLIAIQVYAAWGSPKDFRKELERSPAWCGRISQEEAETFLQGHKPFTFVLREGDQEDLFFISFVQSDSSIAHEDFIFDVKNKKWLHKNSTVVSDEKLELLLHRMMHCDPVICTVPTVTA